MKSLKWVLATLVILVAAFWVSSWFTMRDTGPHAYAPVTQEQKTQAEAYIAAGLQPMPSSWEWETFEPEPGIALRTGRARTQTAAKKGTVLLVPGFTAMLELYSETFQSFLDDGYDVAGIEYRGQGLSHRDLPDPEKGYVSSYDTLASEVAAYIGKLKTDGAGKIHVYANSMGGHIALRMAGEDQPDVDAYFLLVPMVKIETGAFPYSVARALTAFYTYTGLGEAYAPGQGPFVPGKEKLGTPSPCMNNAATAQIRDALYIRDEKYRVAGTTNAWVERTMASTNKITSSEFIERLNKPFLFVTAGDDRWVNTQASTRMCEALGSCEIVNFPGSRHCIDREKPETTREILSKAKTFFDEN